MSEEDIPDFEDMPTEAAPIEDFDQNGLLLKIAVNGITCLLYTSPSPRDYAASRMPSSA